MLWSYDMINFEQFWRKKDEKNTDFFSHLTKNLLEVSLSIHACNDTFIGRQKSSHQLAGQQQSWSQLVGIHDSILLYCYQLELHCSVSLTVATMTYCHIKTLALALEQSLLSWQPASLAAADSIMTSDKSRPTAQSPSLTLIPRSWTAREQVQQ